MMKLRLAAPEYVIDIDPLAAELGYIRERRRRDPDRRDDAPPRPARVRPARARLAIFTDAERVIADPVVRNRGTIGGALCQADPSEDLSAVCAAVGAQHGHPRLATASASSDMHEFHRGPYETAVGPAEMLVEIRVPLRARAGSAYEKVDRRVGDWAVVAAGAALELARRDDRPRRASRSPPSAATSRRRGRGGARGPSRRRTSCSRAAARSRAAACEPVTDQRGSAEYKRHVVGVLTERVAARARAERAHDQRREEV